MPNKVVSERDLFRAALGPSEQCPPIEELELVLTGDAAAAPAKLTQHLKSCAYCQTELHLLSTFRAGGTTEDSEDARKVGARLRGRSREILGALRSTRTPESWWNRLFTARWLAPAALTLAGLLVVAGLVQYRQASSQPTLSGTNQIGQETLRSTGFGVASPIGDIRERPREIRWELVQGAAKYEVRLLEVDRTEVWKADAVGDHIELPGEVQARIVPAKTLFCEIGAFDLSGLKIGETGLVRFRLLRKDETR